MIVICCLEMGVVAWGTIDQEVQMFSIEIDLINSLDAYVLHYADI